MKLNDAGGAGEVELGEIVLELGLDEVGLGGG